jgi:branched-chain amino acid transport system substrate-binding protein
MGGLERELIAEANGRNEADWPANHFGGSSDHTAVEQRSATRMGEIMSVRSIIAILCGLSLASSAFAQKRYDTGATDTEIKLGQTMPYSGPLSAFATLGRAEVAYYHMINDLGGVNGRKITMLSVDDGFSPPKTVEQTRKLVEEDGVLAIVGSLGTATNGAVQKYLNNKKIPQIFLASGATKWADPEHFPWTMTFTWTYQAEARVYASYVVKHVPNAKIAILYQNDDFGKDFLKGFRQRLGSAASTMIVKEATYEVTDTTVDSQIVELAGSGATVFFNITTPKFAAQSIRKAYDIGWHPLQFIDNPAASVGTVMKPAGVEKAKGVLSTGFVKDPTDPQFRDDADFKEWLAWMKQYFPDGSLEDPQNAVGYAQAQTMVQVLKQCGDDLTRENVMRQAANLRNFHPAMLIEGVNLSTSQDNYEPMRKLRMVRFDGERFTYFGEIIDAGAD